MNMAQQPTALETSYSNRAAYPINLIWKASSDFTLDTLKSRLDRFDSPQLTPNNAPYSLRVLCQDGEAYVLYTDIRTKMGQNGVLEHEPPVKDAILTDAGLRNVLGDQDTAGQTPPFKFTKADPQCRLM